MYLSYCSTRTLSNLTTTNSSLVILFYVLSSSPLRLIVYKGATLIKISAMLLKTWATTLRFDTLASKNKDSRCLIFSYGFSIIFWCKSLIVSNCLSMFIARSFCLSTTPYAFYMLLLSLSWFWVYSLSWFCFFLFILLNFVFETAFVLRLLLKSPDFCLGWWDLAIWRA